MRISTRESLCQTFYNRFFYQEKTIKMSFTKAYSLQNLVCKSLFQIFYNLLDSLMFMLAKVCALKAQVNPEPSQTFKMEPFSKLVKLIKMFLTFDEIKKTKSIELLQIYLTFKYKSLYFKCYHVAFRKNQLHPSKSVSHMYIEEHYQKM